MIIGAFFLFEHIFSLSKGFGQVYASQCQKDYSRDVAEKNHTIAWVGRDLEEHLVLTTASEFGLRSCLHERTT